MAGILIRVSSVFRPWLLVALILAAPARGTADEPADRETSRGVLPTASHKVQRQFSLACQAIRQQRFGDWSGAVETMAAHLASFASATRRSSKADD